MQRVIERAKKLSEQGKVIYIVEVDDMDSRKQIVVTDDYLQSDEFEAFDGRVIAEYYNGKEV